jgi:hypothetical protein
VLVATGLTLVGAAAIAAAGLSGRA